MLLLSLHQHRYSVLPSNDRYFNPITSQYIPVSSRTPVANKKLVFMVITTIDKVINQLIFFGGNTFFPQIFRHRWSDDVAWDVAWDVAALYLHRGRCTLGGSMKHHIFVAPTPGSLGLMITISIIHWGYKPRITSEGAKSTMGLCIEQPSLNMYSNWGYIIYIYILYVHIYTYLYDICMYLMVLFRHLNLNIQIWNLTI